MKERPILYSAPMVRAKRAGIKTQTRRIVQLPRGAKYPDINMDVLVTGELWPHYIPSDKREGARPITCPYGEVGDRLWGREAWRVPSAFDKEPGSAFFSGQIWYEADDGYKGAGRYRHARFMPRWASRILDEIVSIRVERLQDISEADARTEGVSQIGIETGAITSTSAPVEIGSYCAAYAELWESINGPGSWGVNPLVWVIETRPV